jgi:hypothetical protein
MASLPTIRRNGPKSDPITPRVKSVIAKRSVIIGGHKTSVSLEPLRRPVDIVP